MKKVIIFALFTIILSLALCMTLNASVTDGTGGKTITLSKTTFYEGEDIVVSYTGADNLDWLGIYPRGGIPGARNEQGNIIGSLSWGYLTETEGTYTFPKDNDNAFQGKYHEAGEYDLYYLLDDAYEVAAKIEITIIKGTNPDILNAPSEVTYERTATETGYAKGSVKIKAPGEGAQPDSYVIYWGNALGKLNNYSPLATIDYKGETTEYVIPDNIIYPQGITGIIVYSKQGSKLSEEFSFAKVNKNDIIVLTNKLFSFNVITDIHIGSSYDAHYGRALTKILQQDPSSKGIFTVGDNTDHGYENEYESLMSLTKEALKDSKIKVYFTLGNHDMQGTDSKYDTQVSLFKKHTGAKNSYYYNIIDGTYFIHLANEADNGWTSAAVISETQLKWLEGLLKKASESKGPVCVFLHQPLYNTVSGSLPGQNWDGVEDDEALMTVLNKYPNVLLFTGHTHWKFDSERPMVDGKGQGANFFNTSAISYLWTDEDKHFDGSQGYFVEVYEKYILVRGYDFELDEWNSNSQFMIRMETVIDSSGSSQTQKKDTNIILPVVIAAVIVAAVVTVVIITKRKSKG